MIKWLRYDPTLQTLVLEQQINDQVFSCNHTLQLLAMAAYVWVQLNRHMKGLIMAYQTAEKRVQAANARTGYYKKQAKELKAEVKRLNDLLNKATTPVLDKNQIMFTKATIAFRRQGNTLVPITDDIYVAQDNA